MMEVPANYIYAKSTSPGFWTPVYIGESGNIHERCLDHHQMECILRSGATHIFTHVSSTDKQTRLNEETDLRHSYPATCNSQ
jgi:hypothetical protein